MNTNKAALALISAAETAGVSARLGGEWGGIERRSCEY